MGTEFLFSWIHVSDIHFGHGDASYRHDQQLVIARLLEDVRGMKKVVPKFDAIFVTGDIAFSAGCKSPSEYEAATEFLNALAEQSGVPSERIFTVPGNHDIQRDADKEREVWRFMRNLREGVENLDDALQHSADCAKLSQRLANYFAFAKAFGPQRSQDGPAPFWWQYFFGDDRPLKVRVIGLNTALLSADDQDMGRLRLGLAQVRCVPARMPEDELVIALSHHPLSGGWLHDQDRAGPYVRNGAHIHLTGHVHAQTANLITDAVGASRLEISAGATHRDPKEGETRDQTYSFGAVRMKASRPVVRVWPRRWSSKHAKFTTSEEVRDGKEYSEHVLPKIRVAPRDRAVAGGEPKPRKSWMEALTGSEAHPQTPLELTRHGVAHFYVALELRKDDPELSLEYARRGINLVSTALSRATEKANPLRLRTARPKGDAAGV